jgi:hypothetical protein
LQCETQIGSIPIRSTNFHPPQVGGWRTRLVARMGAFQAPERGSKPLCATKFGDVVQMARTFPCHGRGRGFESRRHRQVGATSPGRTAAVAVRKPGTSADCMIGVPSILLRRTQVVRERPAKSLFESSILSAASKFWWHGPVWSGRLPVTEKNAGSNPAVTAKFQHPSGASSLQGWRSADRGR